MSVVAEVIRRDLLLSTDRSKNVLTVWSGINDIGGGATGAATYTLIANYCTAAKLAGWTVVVCTLPSCDPAGWSVGKTAERLALNTLLRADHSWSDGLADLDGDPRLQSPTDTTYFDADRIHLTDAGYAVVAGIVSSVVQPLL